MTESAIFNSAVRLPTAERAAYLRRVCGNNSELLRQVEELLQQHDQAGSFLEPAGAASGDTAGFFPTCEATSDSPARIADQAGLLVAGRYKLLEPLGEGGMGTVWMAEQRQPVKRLVALKLIKPGMDSQAVVTRFEAERQALALMDHVNIAKVFDGGTAEGGRPYFAMELVKGLPLVVYCDSRRLSVADRLGLFVQVCAAVQHAHQKGVIHRDLKPANVLVTEHDSTPVPKIIDFGLAKALAAPNLLTDRTLHTSYGTVVGTPLYMAPEQVGINALDVDTRTDIYALGVILYELLTGTTPLEKRRFKEAGWEEVQRLIREEEPLRPSARLSSGDALPSLAANRQTEPAKLSRLVRGELDWIVLKALEKDRNRRYETANGLAMDIRRYLEGEPVLACPPSSSYRLRKLAYKHRAALATATVFGLLLLVGSIVSLGLALRARSAEAEARANFALARQAVQDFLGRVTENARLNVADLHGLRKELLESALLSRADERAGSCGLRPLAGSGHGQQSASIQSRLPPAH
jgi:serine/threonine protein kinase